MEAFLKIVIDIPDTERAAIRQAACKEVREDLDDLKREINREADRESRSGTLGIGEGPRTRVRHRLPVPGPDSALLRRIPA